VSEKPKEDAPKYAKTDEEKANEGARVADDTFCQMCGCRSVFGSYCPSCGRD
jgi:hypothetical protein